MMDNPDNYDFLAKRADELLGTMKTKRTCDGCDLCCTANGVEDRALEKQPGCRCPHLTGKPGASCGVYATRPLSCREFLCVWRGSDKLLGDNLKPSRVGFVLALTSHFTAWPLLFTVHFDPAHPDSWKAPRHKATFKMVAAKFNAIVAVGQSHLATHVFAPDGSEFSRDQFPEYFKDDGKTVGVPSRHFLPFKMSPAQVALALWDL
jgi:hypothetical protein